MYLLLLDQMLMIGGINVWRIQARSATRDQAAF